MIESTSVQLPVLSEGSFLAQPRTMTDLVDRERLVLTQIAIFLESILLKEKADVAGAVQEVVVCGGRLLKQRTHSL